MLIPAHHPGAQAGSRKTLVRDLMERAAHRLPEGKQTRELLEPLELIAKDEETVAGGSGFAIFRSPRFLEIFDVPDCKAEMLAVASHLELAPLVERAFVPQEFFILGISRKRLGLFRYRNGRCESVPLPANVPASVEAAGAFDPPDHDLENRHAAGPSIGSMKGVHFGTGSGRETAVEYLTNFCGIVDQGLKELLAGAPLLLGGVHEEIAAYRRAAKYPHILESEISGNLEFLPLEQIAQQAAAAARDHSLRAGQRVLAEAREMSDRSRTLNDPHEVLRAAAAGRVHRLCVREGTEVRGRMEPELDTVHAATEDLINAAVVETLRHSGEVFMLPPDLMEAAHPLAAILRY